MYLLNYVRVKSVKSSVLRGLGKLSLSLLFSIGFASYAQAQESCQDVFGFFSFPRIIDELDPYAPHTIEDVPSYLRNKIGKETLSEVHNENVDYIILQGPGTLYKNFFTAPDVVKIKEIPNDFGAFNVVRVEFKNGRSAFVFTNVNGESRYLQVLSFLRLARVDENRIYSKGQLVSYNIIYRRTFRALKEVPDLVVFGFSNTSFEIITKNNPVKAREAYLATNHRYATQKWIKPLFMEHELQNMGVQAMTFANGKKVWFIDNEYGDRATVLIEALQNHGVKNILLLGTAGSLNPIYQVGDVVSPQTYADGNGGMILSNTTFSLVQRSGEHVHVDSPALESKRWLKQEIADGNDLVDVELQKAAGVIAPTVHFEAYLVVSDLLNSKTPQDYTKWTEKSRQKSMEALKPILTQSLLRIGVQPTTEITGYKVEYFKTTKGDQ